MGRGLVRQVSAAHALAGRRKRLWKESHNRNVQPAVKGRRDAVRSATGDGGGLAGCADGPFAAAGLGPHPAPEPPATPVAEPAVEKVWYKSGATNEEFERTKARCMLQANLGSLYFAANFTLCMRAEGWTLGPRVRQSESK
jgi:hypothetical protein